ncbi:MAG: hypothetical protein O3C63_05145 [Cyanobacteria bacterium]|nr:hypothetical protein [Cyanobacteriota bacterium]MDA1021016.1 hypothetical protein [Cyanobacteriota bacterium]
MRLISQGIQPNSLSQLNFGELTLEYFNSKVLDSLTKEQLADLHHPSTRLGSIPLYQDELFTKELGARGVEAPHSNLLINSINQVIKHEQKCIALISRYLDQETIQNTLLPVLTQIRTGDLVADDAILEIKDLLDKSDKQITDIEVIEQSLKDMQAVSDTCFEIFCAIQEQIEQA